jgi:hypothetical protein
MDMYKGQADIAERGALSSVAAKGPMNYKDLSQFYLQRGDPVKALAFGKAAEEEEKRKADDLQAQGKEAVAAILNTRKNMGHEGLVKMAPTLMKAFPDVLKGFDPDELEYDEEKEIAAYPMKDEASGKTLGHMVTDPKGAVHVKWLVDEDTLKLRQETLELKVEANRIREEANKATNERLRGDAARRAEIAEAKLELKQQELDIKMAKLEKGGKSGLKVGMVNEVNQEVETRFLELVPEKKRTDDKSNPVKDSAFRSALETPEQREAYDFVKKRAQQLAKDGLVPGDAVNRALGEYHAGRKAKSRSPAAAKGKGKVIRDPKTGKLVRE